MAPLTLALFVFTVGPPASAGPGRCSYRGSTRLRGARPTYGGRERAASAGSLRQQEPPLPSRRERGRGVRASRSPLPIADCPRLLLSLGRGLGLGVAHLLEGELSNAGEALLRLEAGLGPE